MRRITPYPAYGSVLNLVAWDKTRQRRSGGKKRQRTNKRSLTASNLWRENEITYSGQPHLCGHRGDSAIFAAYLMPSTSPIHTPKWDVMSRYPVSHFLAAQPPGNGRSAVLQMKQHNSAAGVVGRVKSPLRRHYQHLVYCSTRHRHWQLHYRHRPVDSTDFTCCQVTTPLFRSADRFLIDLMACCV